jgi:hypothetical protein
MSVKLASVFAIDDGSADGGVVQRGDVHIGISRG